MTGAFSGWTLGHYHLTRRRKKSDKCSITHYLIIFWELFDFNTVNIHRILGFTSPMILISLRFRPLSVVSDAVYV